MWVQALLILRFYESSLPIFIFLKKVLGCIYYWWHWIVNVCHFLLHEYSCNRCLNVGSEVLR